MCGTTQLCGETPNKPPWKGAEDSGFFFSKKGARRPAGAREAAPHRPPPGKGANGTLRGRSPRTPEGVAHGHPDKRRRLGSRRRRRRRPPLHHGRGPRWLRPTEGSVEAPQARKRGPGTRPRSPTSGCPSKGRDVAVWRRDAPPVPGGRAPLLGRAAVQGEGPATGKGATAPEGVTARGAPHRARRTPCATARAESRRTVGHDGAEQRSACPGLGPARSGSRASNTTRSPL